MGHDLAGALLGALDARRGPDGAGLGPCSFQDFLGHGLRFGHELLGLGAVFIADAGRDIFPFRGGFPDNFLGFGLCLGHRVVVVLLSLQLQELRLELVCPCLLEHLAVLLLELLGGVLLDLCPQRLRLGFRGADELLGPGPRLGEDLVHVLFDLGGEVLAFFLAAEDLLDLQDGELLLQIGDEVGQTGILLDLALQLGGHGLHVRADLFGVESREAFFKLSLPDVLRGYLHKRHPSGPELECQLAQARDQEILQEHDRQNYDDR